ncbi:hypothetical protein ACHAXR_000208, partial [Thalassiosira sp. AJA248-18]
MGKLSKDDNAYSSSSSSYLSLSRKKKRHRRHRRRNNNNNNDAARSSNSCRPSSSTAAPSDWYELRAHFQFVLPSNDDINNNCNSNNINNSNISNNDPNYYGSTWQERMVQHYHSHLYKEYVLADLSRVTATTTSGGKVGLRWRTEKEVANGRGFRCCGNLMCEQGVGVSGVGVSGCASFNSKKSSDEERQQQQQEAYSAAAR